MGGESGTVEGLVRLTQTVKAGGCASKLPPGILSEVLATLPRQKDENLLVGFDTADDAGVYRIAGDRALVQTVDFFTPMVDDPFTYGRIAATNALSDVYAMGATPLTALNIVCYPQDGDPAVLGEILRGGLSVMQRAKCVVLGGHSVRDPEMKFGYAVTGLAHPSRIWRNDTARPGDALVFTKALGTGVITTAIKQGKAQSAWIEAAVDSMTTLNDRAAEVLHRFGADVHAVTDVTGFGLMGHGREMALGSRVELVIEAGTLSFLEGARQAVAVGAVPAGLEANRAFAECVVRGEADDVVRTLLYDPQTAGGLLIAIDPARAQETVTRLHEAGYTAAAIIGSVHDGASPGILLR
jgi:selenide, water dikinase